MNASKLNRGQITQFLLRNAVSIVMLLFVIFMVFYRPSFANWANISVIINECAIYGITACAMSASIVCGEVDISVGSTYAWSTAIMCLLCDRVGFVGALLLTLLSGVLLGAFNGLLVSRVRMPAFVATLGTMTSIKGLTYICLPNAEPYNTTNATLKALGSVNVAGIDIVPFVFVAVLIAFILIMRFTRFGRGIYATGGNYEVARLSGINVKFYKWIIFVMLGFCAALSGIMYTTRIMAGSATYGTDLALHCVSATVIGGTSLSGGNGGPQRTIIGILLLAIMFNALTLLGVDGSMQKFIRGLVLIVIIMLDATANRRKAA